jgi:hypothetical protein
VSLTSRRELLTAAGIFAVAGVGVSAARFTPDAGPSAEAATSDVVAIDSLPALLHAADVRIARPGTRPGSQPAPGTPALPFGILTTADGEVVGSFDTHEMTGGRTPVHLQRLDFETGGIVGVGPASSEGTFTIVGATGRFSPTGAYTVNRVDSDTFHFTFHTALEA